MESMEKKKVECLEFLLAADVLMDRMIRMVEEEEPCMDIAMEIISAQDFLKKANRVVLRNHLSTSLTSLMKEGNQSASFPEMIEIMGRILG